MLISTSGSAIQGKKFNQCADVVLEPNPGKPEASFSIMPGIPLSDGYAETKGGAVPLRQN